MADPTAANLNQLRNIEGRTGESIASLHARLDATGLAKHGEKRTWLMENLGLGYGDANAVVGAQGKDLSALHTGAAPSSASTSGADPLDAIYVGGKAHLRGLHDAVIAVVDTFGEYEVAPKKAYVSLRRAKQFATVGPATKDLVEIGLNVKGLPERSRLKAMPAGSMCPYTLRLGRADEIDADLTGWIKAAYDAAG